MISMLRIRLGDRKLAEKEGFCAAAAFWCPRGVSPAAAEEEASGGGFSLLRKTKREHQEREHQEREKTGEKRGHLLQ